MSNKCNMVATYLAKGGGGGKRSNSCNMAAACFVERGGGGGKRSNNCNLWICKKVYIVFIINTSTNYSGQK